MATQFIFLVLPKLHLMDLAGPDQTIFEAKCFGADFQITYCGVQEKPVTSAGLGIQTLTHFSKVDIRPGDYLIIPGSCVDYILSGFFKKERAMLEWIRNAYQEKKAKVVSICAGAFILAESGLLDGVPCTTHFKRTQQLQKCYPKAEVIENVLFVEHAGIYTSAGIASGIDLMLHIIEQLTDSYFTHKVARELVIYNRREGSQAQESAYLQHRNHIHSGIHKAQDVIIENIHKKIYLHELADIACMSERNFTRVFKKETGITPNDYITKIRLEKIQELIRIPELSRKQIANQVGLESERHLNRLINQN